MSATLRLFLQVLPLAIGAAMSPTFLLMQVAVLASPAPGAVRRGWALAAGSMVTLLVLSFGGISLLAQLPDFQKGAPSLSQSVILLLAGSALVGLGWWERRRPVSHHEGLLARLVDASAPAQFGIGAARLAVNATTLALYIPALHVITQSSAPAAGKVLAFLMLFVVTEAAVLGPMIAVTVMGDRATPFLTRLRDVVEAHSRQLTVLVCWGFGVVLLAVGLWVLVQVA